MKKRKLLLVSAASFLLFGVVACQAASSSSSSAASSNESTSSSASSSSQSTSNGTSSGTSASSQGTSQPSSTSSAEATSSSSSEQVTLASIEAKAVRSIYVIGDTISKTDVVVTAVYSDNTKKEVSDFTISKTGALDSPISEYEVAYQNKTAKVAISVYNPQTREAEDAALSNGVSVRAESGAAGKYTGSGYVGGFDGKAGGTVTFTFDSSKEAAAEFYVTNDIPSPDFNDNAFTSRFSIKVNGNDYSTDARMHTDAPGWFAFAKTTLGEITLVQGKNVITLVSTTAMTNLDSISFGTDAAITDHVVESVGKDYYFEAENADSNAWLVDKFWKLGKGQENADAASNGCYVGHIGDVAGQKDGDGNYYYLRFNVYAQAAAPAVLYFQAGIPAGLTLDDAFPMTVNGVGVSTGFATSGNGAWTDWAKYKIGGIDLAKGLNTIQFDDVGALMNLDCLILNTTVTLSTSAL